MNKALWVGERECVRGRGVSECVWEGLCGCIVILYDMLSL